MFGIFYEIMYSDVTEPLKNFKTLRVRRSISKKQHGSNLVAGLILTSSNLRDHT